MEHLPPKSPITMTHNWAAHSSFPFQMMAAAPPPPPLSATTSGGTWVDDFLDFTAARRSHHRRTVSDPIAFMETPSLMGDNHHHSFERLGDEQLSNMFYNNDVGPLSGSDPSGDNSDNSDEQKMIKSMSKKPNVKNEPGEEEEDNELGEGGNNDFMQNKASLDNSCNVASSEAIVDPKRIKRILANRQSAQRSRVRKLHYISELERSVTTLQTEVSALSPRVAFLDHQRLLLNVDNSALRQRIAALAQDKIFKDAHQEALKKEIERLRRIYHEQTAQKMGTDEEPPLAAVTTTAANERVSSQE